MSAQSTGPQRRALVLVLQGPRTLAVLPPNGVRLATAPSGAVAISAPPFRHNLLHAAALVVIGAHGRPRLAEIQRRVRIRADDLLEILVHMRLPQAQLDCSEVERHRPSTLLEEADRTRLMEELLQLRRRLPAPSPPAAAGPSNS